MDKRQTRPTQDGGDTPQDHDQQQAVRHGRVGGGPGKGKTLWQLIKAGLVQVDRPPSKHRVFTHAPKSHAWRRRKKRRRQIARASRRAQRPPKRKTGVSPVR
jgi:hypothetical protein